VVGGRAGKRAKANNHLIPFQYKSYSMEPAYPEKRGMEGSRE
jgi:hypothetical protein